MRLRLAWSTPKPQQCTHCGSRFEAANSFQLSLLAGGALGVTIILCNLLGIRPEWLRLSVVLAVAVALAVIMGLTSRRWRRFRVVPADLTPSPEARRWARLSLWTGLGGLAAGLLAPAWSWGVMLYMQHLTDAAKAATSLTNALAVSRPLVSSAYALVVGAIALLLVAVGLLACSLWAAWREHRLRTAQLEGSAGRTPGGS